jgi:Pvc16 N-terminal domain
MLYKSLEFLREQLTIYLSDKLPDGQGLDAEKLVKLENIAILDEGTLKNTNNILISLVNIAEETTLKNIPHYERGFPNTIYRNPPIYLNLFVLISAVFKKYDAGLILLSHVVRFFQGKQSFDQKNSFTQVKDLDEFSLILDLYSPTFEQANYLWSTLGGKQHPYVLYKLRLVEMKRENKSEERGIIREVQTNEGKHIIPA